MFLAQGPQRSDAGKARTRGLSVSSQALYYWATAPPPPPQKKRDIQSSISVSLAFNAAIPFKSLKNCLMENKQLN